MKVILAPHPDDEIIGCFKLLKAGAVKAVLYFFDCEGVRLAELARFCRDLGLEYRILRPVLHEVESAIEKLKPEAILVPHPRDYHPHHKTICMLGQALAGMNENLSIKYYSVEMNVPDLDILEPVLREEKRAWLDKYYPSQKKLWETNPKYYLFEYVSKYPSIPSVVIELNVYGFHQARELEGEGKLYENPHSHVFKVSVEIGVSHLDRDIEFYDFRTWLTTKIYKMYRSEHGVIDFGFRSCEEIARDIYYQIKKFFAYRLPAYIPVKVEVAEDTGCRGVYGDRFW